jgi:hypothetical protein
MKKTVVFLEAGMKAMICSVCGEFKGEGTTELVAFKI